LRPNPIYLIYTPVALKIIRYITHSFKGLPTEVWLLSAVSLINRSGAMVISFMTLYLTQALNFDIRSAGYVMSSYGLGSIVGAYIGGQLTDKYGYYKVQFWTLVSSGLFLFIAVWIKDFWLMCATMFIFSVISEAFRPANSVAIKQHSTEETRTRSFSLMRAAVNLAISVALVVGGILASLGWHWLFYADAITCLGAAFLVRYYLKEKQPPLIPPSAVQATPSVFVEEKRQNTTDNSAYKDGDYLLFVVLTFVGATVFMQIMWTVPAFFKDIYGWNTALIGIMAAINGIAVLCIEMPLIFRIENKRAPMHFIRIGILLYAISYLAFLVPKNWSILIAVFYMIVISFGEIFVMPFSTSWATKRAGDANQGQYMALYSMAYAVSNVIAPMMGTQIIAAFGYPTLWIVSAFLAGLTWLGFLYLERKTT
jgi:predicted MFS family arabinose efflux permease